MIEISYVQMLVFISAVWLFVRGVCWLKQKSIRLRREAALLLVYICIAVVVRFTFCPFGTVNGKIQPLVFDPGKIWPFWLNWKPFIYLFDYPEQKDAWLNLIGNVAMFIPLGIVWPAVFRKLNTHWKVIAAGVGVSACIELMQLPFYARSTDIDDLILNSAGYILGYGIYLLTKNLWRKYNKKET